MRIIINYIWNSDRKQTVSRNATYRVDDNPCLTLGQPRR